LRSLGHEMHGLCSELFPICRSITGNGLRQSLEILKKHIPELVLHEIPTGTKCFDWEIPKEWNINDGYIITPSGKKICDFKKSNLHVVGYSLPIDKILTLDKLQKHLHSIPNQPVAIPYVTSYYNEYWGFCISQIERDQLVPGEYKVFIDSQLSQGSLTYGELILPGNSKKEIFLSTYICHPSMANNELSGPIVTTFLAKWLSSMSKRKYTYRIVFIPETIGSIAYLSKNYNLMQKNIVAGFNITCIGDNRTYSYLPSRNGNTLSDRVAKHVLKYKHPDFIKYSFLDRGSDERQYCSPGIDLPVCSIMRSKYACYPEYHTSLDDLNLVTPEGLLGGYELLQVILKSIELDEVLSSNILCEPQLGKRELYPNISIKDSAKQVRVFKRVIKDFLAYCDGTLSNIEIAEKIDKPIWELKDIIQKLKEKKVLARAIPLT